MNPSTLSALALLASALSAPVAAQALIVPIQEIRTIECAAGGATASDAGVPGTLFDENVYVSGGSSAAGASQRSWIGPESMDIFGDQSGSSYQVGDAWSASTFDVTFTLTAKCDYAFSGTIEGYDNGYAEAYLYQGGGGYIAGTIGIAAGVHNLSYSGTLDPGEYRVLVRAYGGGEYAFARYDMDLSLTARSGAYCPAAANSVGAGAALAFSGSQDIGANDFVLVGSGAPAGAFGLFIYGDTQASIPVGNGTLCVGQRVFRLNTPFPADGAGAASLPLDFNAAPLAAGPGAVEPGTTWNFQWIYRDTVGAGFNFSNGLWVSF